MRSPASEPLGAFPPGLGAFCALRAKGYFPAVDQLAVPDGEGEAPPVRRRRSDRRGDVPPAAWIRQAQEPLVRGDRVGARWLSQAFRPRLWTRRRTVSVGRQAACEFRVELSPNPRALLPRDRAAANVLENAP